MNSVNLERVRKIKSRITRLTTRVAKVREELERFLDDDSDMRDMYLTRKKEAAAAEADAEAAREEPGDGAGAQPGSPGSGLRRINLGGPGRQPSLNMQPFTPYGMNAEAALDPFDDSDLEEVEVRLYSILLPYLALLGEGGREGIFFFRQ